MIVMIKHVTIFNYCFSVLLLLALFYNLKQEQFLGPYNEAHAIFGLYKRKI